MRITTYTYINVSVQLIKLFEHNNMNYILNDIKKRHLI